MAGRHGRTKKAIRPWRNKLDICMRLTMQSFGDFEAPCSKLQGMFCPTAVLRADCKEFYNL
jgi:hypothetical protein